MSENHGFFAQDALRVEKLINAVNNPNYGWLVDMGNFTCADENPAISVGIAAPYAFYVHAKDFIIKPADGPNPGKFFFQSRNGNYLRGTIVGQGNVPVKHCLMALKRAGYDGYVAIEFEGMEDCLLALEAGCENLKRYIAEIEG
jgi:sugar phosphate isomerase/epimerase